MNGKDPLQDAPDSQRALFDKLTREASGHSFEHVLGACLNIVLNALRQNYARRDQAEARFNDLVGNCRQTLRDHYDSNTGKRRTVFPYTQVIKPPLIVDDDSIYRP